MIRGVKRGKNIQNIFLSALYKNRSHVRPKRHESFRYIECIYYFLLGPFLTVSNFCKEFIKFFQFFVKKNIVNTYARSKFKFQNFDSQFWTLSRPYQAIIYVNLSKTISFMTPIAPLNKNTNLPGPSQTTCVILYILKRILMNFEEHQLLTLVIWTVV